MRTKRAANGAICLTGQTFSWRPKIGMAQKFWRWVESFTAIEQVRGIQAWGRNRAAVALGTGWS
jgi:hypothetical protein